MANPVLPAGVTIASFERAGSLRFHTDKHTWDISSLVIPKELQTMGVLLLIRAVVWFALVFALDVATVPLAFGFCEGSSGACFGSLLTSAASSHLSRAYLMNSIVPTRIRLLSKLSASRRYSSSLVTASTDDGGASRFSPRRRGFALMAPVVAKILEMPVPFRNPKRLVSHFKAVCTACALFGGAPLCSHAPAYSNNNPGVKGKGSLFTLRRHLM